MKRARVGGWGVVGFWLILVAVAGAGFEATVEDVSGDAYFPAVHAALNAATGSIVVAMYQMRVPEMASPGQPVRALVDDLVAAQQRGVDVTVVLDRSLQYKAAKKRSKVSSANDTAADILLAGGVDVAFGKPGRLIHQKVIVIDVRTVITGSHNWSYYALTRNSESGELICSPEYARVKIDNIAAIETAPAEIRPPEITTRVALPAALLTHLQMAPRMLAKQDERAFDTYLLLRRYGGGTNSVLSLDFTRMATDLGMDLDAGATAYRQQIIKTLRKLKSRYALIDVTFKHGGPATVTIDPVEGPTIRVPLAYWTYGVNHSLSMREKVIYLLALHETAKSPNSPLWSASGNTLSTRYGIPMETIRSALTGLERLDILATTRYSGTPGQPLSKRRPNAYRLTPLISPEAREALWEELRQKHGAEQFQAARELAGTIHRSNHYETIEALLRYIDSHGLPAVQAATVRVAALHPNNPMRHVRYIITLVKNAQPGTP
jgi:hypothetical protein